MDNDDYLEFKKQISVINEKRIVFWTAYRNTRNQFLRKYPRQEFESDPKWQEILCLLNDMEKSTFTEELRRKLFHNPNSIIDGATPKTGLYKGRKKCVVCGLPLTGRQKSYCSATCRDNAKSRKWRKENPDEKRKSELKYLKYCFPDE